MMIRLRTKGIREIPTRKMLKEYKNQARAAMIEAVTISLVKPTSIREKMYSAGLNGLAKRFRKFLDQTSSRKETDIPWWARKRISQRIKAPRKKGINFGKFCRNWAK